MKTREWYKEQINNLQDWLLDEKIIKSKNDVEKEAYKTVLHKVIDMFVGEDDGDWDNLREAFYEMV